MDPDRLGELLGLSYMGIECLKQAGLVHSPPTSPQPKKRADYVALQRTYARMLADGPFSNQVELARHLPLES